MELKGLRPLHTFVYKGNWWAGGTNILDYNHLDILKSRKCEKKLEERKN